MKYLDVHRNLFDFDLLEQNLEEFILLLERNPKYYDIMLHIPFVLQNIRGENIILYDKVVDTLNERLAAVGWNKSLKTVYEEFIVSITPTVIATLQKLSSEDHTKCEFVFHYLWTNGYILLDFSLLPYLKKVVAHSIINDITLVEAYTYFRDNETEE